MNCETYSEWISEQLDGELDAKRAQELNQHLAACDTCRKTLQVMERLDADLRELPRYEPADRASMAIVKQFHALAVLPRRIEFSPVMDIKELAEFLRVTTDTIGTYLDDIPSFEIGGKLLFRRSSVEKWIEKREHWIETAGTPDLMITREQWRN